MQGTEGKKKNWSAMVVLLLLMGVACWYLWQDKQTAVIGEEKAIVIQVVHGDQSTREIPVTTVQEFLGPVLVNAGIVRGEQGPEGLQIHTVDGEMADEIQQQWWRLTKDGTSVVTGADETPIAQDDHFELTLTTGK